MNVKFRASFKKDLKRIKDPKLLENVSQVITTVKSAESLAEISSLKKFKGYDDFYRVRTGDFRIGIRLVGDEIIFVRLLHRKEIYRFFP
ncbi:type II toxin-antitoxin system RelE/ParE family toxin [Nodosilinea sp. LEGE 06152]|uniref:type II toxin-antitoxin system RelE/ParE family toxin n=1 Tax=Nodosilinea sp. LEGE 06152 TaxID=2777966 RepID=UPI001880AD06|nr:type II toxin-antitoxin system RelE/ParE family toxin [Nodosilinea sp. LEGE 06152]